MSKYLIGFGCDLQQKLDATNNRLRRSRWAGDVGEALYRIARQLHAVNVKASRSGRMNRRATATLLADAQLAVNRLGKGIEVHRQSNPIAWPLYVVFPGDVRADSDFQAIYEQGIAVPPRP